MKKLKKKKYIYLALLFMIPILVLAKYIYSTYADSFFKSQGFYFSSSLLTTDNKTYHISNWDGKIYTLDVDLTNIENDKLWTSRNIDYTFKVECPASVTCHINDGDAAVESSLLHNTMKGTTNYEQISILPNQDFKTGDEIEIKVTATSISPYKKELSAIFHFDVSSYGIDYSVDDSPNRLYATLMINNTLSTSKNITVTVDTEYLNIDISSRFMEQIIQDNHHTMMDDKVNSITFSIDPNEEVAITLYKTNISDDYSSPIYYTNKINISENS